MTSSTHLDDHHLDRTMRRMGCLVRLDAARRTAERRRRSAATELEVLVRRAEQSVAG
jgi:hypothetical protein